MKNTINKLFGLLAVAVLVTIVTACTTQVTHTHTYATTWSSDETYHWYEATCGDTDEVSEKNKHTFGAWNSTTEKRSCTVCGYEQLCSHTFGSWVDGKHTCTVCGYQETCSHTFGSWTDGKKTCTICGYVQTCEHTWNSGVVTTAPGCYTNGVRTYTCSVCSKTKTEEIAALGLCETVIDAETGKAPTSSTKYVYFGVFPQSVLPEDGTISVDETESKTMGMNTYYKGSDGEYYAKSGENARDAANTYSDGSSVLEKDISGNYQGYRYFKVEPIKWRVLTSAYDYDGSAGTKTAKLLFAENILTASVPYYSYDDGYNKRTIGEVSNISANNYMYSQIRAYLNGLSYYNDSNTAVSDYDAKGFLQTAFTTAAQAKINTTTVVNDGESTTDAAGNLDRADGYSGDGETLTGWDDYTCENTEDKIFLLSTQEITTTDYGFGTYDDTEESCRIITATDYALANLAVQSDTEGCGSMWYIRSPSPGVEYESCGVLEDSNISNRFDAKDKDYGIVPAMTMSF